MKAANYAPVYAAALYPDLAEIARAHGYALAVHGSMARDFDLVCVPWTWDAAEPQTVVDAMCHARAIRQHEWAVKEHNRRVIVISIGFGECFIDLSFMPRMGE